MKMSRQLHLAFVLSIALLSGCLAITDFDRQPGGACTTDDDCVAGAGANAECVAGVCVTGCQPGFADCDGLPGNGCEVNTQTDTLNCGGCGDQCEITGAVAACISGGCAIESCRGSNADCDGMVSNGCETSLASVAHCRGCNMGCEAPFNFCEVAADETRSCVEMCSTGFDSCGDSCVDTQTNVEHCGGCDQVCEGGNASWMCAGAACAVAACDDGFLDCNGDATDGCEVDTRDPATCGSCDNACDLPNVATESCNAGECGVAVCADGFDDCDGDPTNGCEVDLRSTTAHCGTCDNVCEGGDTEWMCTDRVCVATDCSVGFADCDMSGDSCEVNVTSDVNHCGMCGQPCEGMQAMWMCQDRACVVDSCEANAADCDGEDVNGCEVDTLTDANNCGGCGNTCPFGCEGGTCREVDDVVFTLSARCILRSDGHVFCAGDDANGQLGQGVADRPSAELLPVLRPDTGLPLIAETLAAGEQHTCAIDAESALGRVWCWGRNTNFAVGMATPPLFIPEPSLILGNALYNNADIVQIDANENTTCARSAAGQVWCWGASNYGQLPQSSSQSRPYQLAFFDGSSPGTTATDIAIGEGQACAVLESGGMRCWGWEGYGNLGNGSVTTFFRIAMPVSIPSGVTAVDVDSDEFSTCFIADDGALYCWGRNHHGQLGVGGTNLRSVPTQVLPFGPGNEALEVVRSRESTCVRAAMGIYCFGRTARGNVATGTVVGNELTPRLVSDLVGNEEMSGATRIVGGTQATCALLPGGASPVCWGSASQGALGDIHARPSLLAPGGMAANVRDAKPGQSGGCAAMTDGTVQCWGRNNGGNWRYGLQDGSVEALAVNTVQLLTTAESVSLGFAFSCAIADQDDDGEHEAWCWGNGNSNRLGAPAPVSPVPREVTGLTGDVLQIDSGESHSCALHVVGGIAQVSCWGFNDDGQCGRAPSPSTNVNTVPLTCTPTQVDVGFKVGCAVCDDGTVQCWGNGDDGQRGDGVLAVGHTPVVVSGITNASAVRVGRRHTCVLADEDPMAAGDELYCFGRNEYGEIGDGTTDIRSTPFRLASLSDVTDVGVGLEYTCALVAMGEVYCWGRGNRGILGDGWADDALAPQLVAIPPGADVVDLRVSTAGSSHRVIALRADGSAISWGLNNYGAAGVAPPYQLTATPSGWSTP